MYHCLKRHIFAAGNILLWEQDKQVYKHAMWWAYIDWVICLQVHLCVRGGGIYRAVNLKHAVKFEYDVRWTNRVSIASCPWRSTNTVFYRNSNQFSFCSRTGNQKVQTEDTFETFQYKTLSIPSVNFERNYFDKSMYYEIIYCRCIRDIYPNFGSEVWCTTITWRIQNLQTANEINNNITEYC